MTISYEDFKKVEMRIGRIVEINDFPEARKPAYKLVIDFGEFGRKNSSAQISANYTRDDLLNAQVVAVTNFVPKRIAGFKSEVLVLGALDSSGEVIILKPEKELPLGNRVF
jgi:tRNA-binding protein